MKRKLVVFDMDDVMYNFNEKVAALTGVPYHKFTQFDTYSNPNMTEGEKERVLAAYQNPDTYRDIVFLKPVIDLINGLHRDHPELLVIINSNCAGPEIRDIKMEQLLPVLDLPKSQIHLNVIDMETQSLQKKLPEDMFIIVDDSIHNIIMADALHKIMPARPHNEGTLDAEGHVCGWYVDRPMTAEDLVATVMKYVKRGIEND